MRPCARCNRCAVTKAFIVVELNGALGIINVLNVLAIIIHYLCGAVKCIVKIFHIICRCTAAAGYLFQHAVAVVIFIGGQGPGCAGILHPVHGGAGHLAPVGVGVATMDLAAEGFPSAANGALFYQISVSKLNAPLYHR